MSSRKRKAPRNTAWRNGVLWARFEIKGKPYRFSLHTDSVEVATGRVKAEMDRLNALVRFGDGRKTWEEAVTAWLPNATRNIGPETLKRYKCSLEQVSLILTPKTFLDELNATLIWEIVNDRRDDGVTDATIRRDLTAIASVCKFVAALRWPGASNPTRDIMELVTERRDPIVLPDAAHIEAVAQWIEADKEWRGPGVVVTHKDGSPMLAAMTRAALLTGCRQSELATLTWPRIDLGARQATIIGKGNKLRTIDLGDAYGLFARLPRHNRTEYVFWHGEGARYLNVASRFAGYVGEVERRSIEAGVAFRAFCFHDMRHKFAVDFLKTRRGTIYDLQLHLGHSSVTTTEGYLKYLTPEEALAAKHGATVAAPAPRLSLVG